jgi:two-component system, cell cycle sensor histidine kinase and response regulator CckA
VAKLAITPERIIHAAFVALLVILISVGVLAYRSTSSLVANAQSVRRAQTVQTGLWELLASINTAEIAQGRFVMTGDDRVLSGLEAAVPRIQTIERSLRESIGRDPKQLAGLDELQRLVERRIRVARELVALRRSDSSEAAIKRIATGETAALQTQIRSIVDTMTTSQETHIQQSERDTLATARKAGAILLFGGLLAFAAVLFAVVYADSSLSTKKLAERERRLELAVAAARLGTWDWDLRTGKIIWSGVHEQLWGMKGGAFKGDYKEFERRVHEEDRDRLKNAVKHALETKTEYNAEYRIIWPDGSVHWMAGRGHGLYEGDQAVRMIGVVSDISDRRAAELAQEAAQQQLQSSETRLRGVLDGMFAFVGLFSTDGILLEANRAPLEAAKVKKSDVIGKPVIDTFWINHSPKTQAQLTRAIECAARGETVREDLDIRVADGSLIILDTIFNPLYDAEGRIIQVVGSGVDVTARKQAEAVRQKLEAQLWQAQKMEALGTLAGGVAHDFNNILSAITGNAELAKQDIAPDHPAATSINEIRKASERAKFLVQQILAFSRKQTSERVSIALQPVVEECTAMLRATLPANVELCVHCEGDTPNVLADANQIHQVLLNLGTNAWHALAGRSGRIDITLEPALIETEVAQQHANLCAGRYACLRVTDSGVGMDESTLVRIFEPFFTTKAVGEGTGLGLSVVDGIVKSHEGAIRVTSKPGAGSTFELLFPAANEASRVSAGSSAPQTISGGGRRILYLDDDEALVSLTVKLLKRNGYHAVGYTEPKQALAVFHANPAQFDLLVTDYSMPGTSGIQVVKQIKQLRPDLPVILASGYVTEDLKQSAREAGVRHVISKPQTVTELCEIVQRTLAETSERTA